MEMYLDKFFQRYDQAKACSLGEDQLRDFLADLFRLRVNESEADKEIHEQLVEMIQPGESGKYERQTIFDFFMLKDGYMVYKQLVSQQKQKSKKRDKIDSRSLVNASLISEGESIPLKRYHVQRGDSFMDLD